MIESKILTSTSCVENPLSASHRPGLEALSNHLPLRPVTEDPYHSLSLSLLLFVEYHRTHPIPRTLCLIRNLDTQMKTK